MREQILAMLRSRFDRRIMNNIHRSEFFECLVAVLLGPEWTLPWVAGHDWAPWDLKHVSGIKLEVKQAAARQTWHTEERFQPKAPRFDIAPRKRIWTSDRGWIDQPGRTACVYVFAWHPEVNEKIADQRDPEQWTFYVVRTKRLPPNQDSIGLSALQDLSRMVQAGSLASAVNNPEMVQREQQLSRK